jgi:hypothetical protein
VTDTRLALTVPSAGFYFLGTFSSCFGAELAPGILEIACKMLERTLGMLCEMKAWNRYLDSQDCAWLGFFWLRRNGELN